MSLTTYQQIAENIKTAESVLITFKKDFKGDALASALALAKALRKIGKEVDILSDNFKILKNHDFLMKNETIHVNTKKLKKFVISLNLEKTKINDLSYDIEGNKLNIYITPKDGYFTKEDINSADSPLKHDLIFIIDTPDLESLGKIYEENTEFFYEKPVINIDHKARNENFGNINLVDITATSTAEILFNLFNSLNAKLIEPDIATCLLAGIISATKSFKGNHVTPKALNIASKLVEVKARRDEIIKNLYYNRSMQTLKLWGKLLTKLEHEHQNKLVWGTLEAQDFHQTKTEEHHLPEIIDELISNIPEAEIVVLVYETKDKQVRALVNSFKNHDAYTITQKFNPSGNKDVVSLQLPNKTLAEAQKEIVNELSQYLKTTLATQEG